MSREAQPNGPPGGFSRYWSAYGGWKALRSSKYLWTAVVCSAFTAPIWLKEPWWDTPLAVLPNLLGFTLGGYALLVSFGDEKFKAFLIEAEVKEKTSAFMTVSAAFIHFILVQASALLVAILARAFFTIPNEWIAALGNESPRPHAQELALQFAVGAWWWFGFLLFLYSITSIVAVGMAVFEVTGWFNDHQLQEQGEGDEADGEQITVEAEKIIVKADEISVTTDPKRTRTASSTTTL